MARSLKELIVTFEANAKPVLNALNQIDAKLKHTSNSLRSTGESFSRLGRELGLTLSLPIATFGGASLKAVADIQSLEASLTSVLAKFNTGIPIQQAVANEIEHLGNITNELGVSFSASVKPYVKYLAASKDSLETNRRVMKSFLGLSTGLGLSADDVNRVIRALEQMQSKGKVMAEELRLQLGDAVPGAVNLFAEAMGVSEAELFKLMEQGKISSDVLSKVADTIDKKYGAAIDKGSKTLRANANRISNAFYMLRVSVGKGIDETFKVNDKMSSFANWLIKLAESFAKLDEKSKKVLLSTGLFLAAIGPLLVGLGAVVRILGFAVLGFNFLIKPIVLLIGFLPRIIAGFKLLGIILAANPLGAFITATTLIVTYWKEIVELFKIAGKFVGKFIPGRSEIKDNLNKSVYGSSNDLTDYKPLLSTVGSFINDFTGAFNNFLAKRDLLPEGFLYGGKYNSPVNNQKTINNNLTVNIPAGMSGSDSSNIKNAIKQALQEENRQTYIELGAQ